MNADGISWSMYSFEGIEVKAMSLEKLHEHYIDSPNVLDLKKHKNCFNAAWMKNKKGERRDIFSTLGDSVIP